MMMMKRAGLACVASCVCLGLPGVAAASPWTLPQHELVLATDFGFSVADSEYLNAGERQRYPLRGVFEQSSLGLGARYGFTDQFEMEARVTFKQVSFDIDPVILEISPFVETDDAGQTRVSDDATLEQIRASVIDFGSTQLGAADLDVAARYNLYKGWILVTPQIAAKIPLGYEGPRATFDQLDIGSPQIEVGDDVTLGDGQVDLSASLLLGTYIPQTRTFVRADAGFNWRFAAPGNQLLANAKVGQFLLDRFILFGGVRYARTVSDGSSIGDTFVDTNPTQSAADYQFAGNVEIRPLFLDRDFVTIEAGAIVNLDRVEIQVVYTDVIDGRNYADLRGVNVGVITSIPDATRQGGEDELEPTEEVEVVEEVILVPVDEGEDEGEQEPKAPPAPTEPPPEPEAAPEPAPGAPSEGEPEVPPDGARGTDDVP
jgi:hypothetical protein